MIAVRISESLRLAVVASLGYLAQNRQPTTRYVTIDSHREVRTGYRFKPKT
jgi:hypothetical protein